jgi:hypothetical protein
MFFVPLATEREDHVVCVEIAGRGEGIGGLEFNAFTQVKGVFRAIGRYVPAGCKARNDGGRAALELYQTVEDLTRGGVKGGTRGVKLL